MPDRKRLTAEQVLGHPWMKENGVADDQAFTPEVLTRLRAFGKMNFLKKEALKVRGLARCDIVTWGGLNTPSPG